MTARPLAHSLALATTAALAAGAVSLLPAASAHAAAEEAARTWETVTRDAGARARACLEPAGEDGSVTVYVRHNGKGATRGGRTVVHYRDKGYARVTETGWIRPGSISRALESRTFTARQIQRKRITAYLEFSDHTVADGMRLSRLPEC